MRIRGEHLPQQGASLAVSTPQYSAPTELTQILETGSYKDSAPTELTQIWNLEAIKILLLRSRKLGTLNSKIWSASILALTAVGLASEAAPSERSYE